MEEKEVKEKHYQNKNYTNWSKSCYHNLSVFAIEPSSRNESEFLLSPMYRDIWEREEVHCHLHCVAIRFHDIWGDLIPTSPSLAAERWAEEKGMERDGMKVQKESWLFFHISSFFVVLRLNYFAMLILSLAQKKQMEGLVAWMGWSSPSETYRMKLQRQVLVTWDVEPAPGIFCLIVLNGWQVVERMTKQPHKKKCHSVL